MLRGYQRRVIFLKNTDSELFEEAYFLLRDREHSQRVEKRELIEEAIRIIDSKDNGTARRGRRAALALLKFIFPFLIGALTGGAILFFVLI